MGAGIDYWSHDTRFANDYWDNGVQSSDVGSNSGGVTHYEKNRDDFQNIENSSGIYIIDL